MNHLHSPGECNAYITQIPMEFSHLRYFKIQIRKILLKRTTNAPFISGDSVASIADLNLISRKQIAEVKAKKVTSADSIFVAADYLEDLLDYHWSNIRCKTLITGNSDRNFESEVLLPPSIKLWLCQNSAVLNSEIMRTLPIGIENRKLGRAGLKKYFLRSNITIRDKVFVPPMSPTNPVRRPVILECMDRDEIFDVFLKMMNEEDYFELASRYRFVLCLEGNGYENHRIWETLYNGGIPILLRTSWSVTLSYLKLPIILIENIGDISAQALREFDEKFAEFSPQDCKALWTTFWRQVIKDGHL